MGFFESSGPGGTGIDSDEKVKVSSNDTTSGVLNGKLVAGTNITLVEGNDGGDETLTINSPAGAGEANTASNVGTSGVGVFKQKTGDNLELKKINAGSNKITITDDVGDDEVDIDVVPSNINHDVLLNYAIAQHRIINDAGTLITELFSASEIITRLATKAASSHNHAATEITSGVLADARVQESNVTQHVAAINHDALLNFAVGEHRIINDAGTLTTELFSAAEIISRIAAGGGLANIVEDVTPQLGGGLDVNGNSIISASAGDIAITPDTTGDVILDGLKWPQVDGDTDFFLKTDGVGQLSWAAGASGAVESSGSWSPQLWDDTLSGSESQTYTIQLGRYRKIGSLIYIAVDLEMLSLGTLTTSQAVRIGNLPFTSANNGIGGSMIFGFGGSLAFTALSSPAGLVVANNNYINIRQWDATVGANNLLISELTSDGRLLFSGTYEAA